MIICEGSTAEGSESREKALQKSGVGVSAAGLSQPWDLKPGICFCGEDGKAVAQLSLHPPPSSLPVLGMLLTEKPNKQNRKGKILG